MFALVLFFTVAFGQGIDYTICDQTLMQNTNIKYLTGGEYGHKTVKDLNQCLTTGGYTVHLFPCNDDTLIFTQCGNKGNHYQQKEVAEFGNAWVEQLQPFVAYGVEQDDSCKNDQTKCTIQHSARMHIFESKCYFEEEGIYSKFLIESNKVIKRYFTDSECTNVNTSEGDDTNYNLECNGLYELDSGNQKPVVRIICSNSIPTPPSGEQQPVTCDPSLATKYKYLVNGQAVMDLSQCTTMQGNSVKITPCTETHVTVGACGGQGGNPMPISQLFDGFSYSETLPGGENTETCESGFGSDYKYVIFGDEGDCEAYELKKCIKDVEEKYQYIPCKDGIAKKVTCKEDGEEFIESLDGVKFETDLPAHIAHRFEYSDDNCKTQVEGKIYLYMNGCVESEGTSYKYAIDGNKIVSKPFSDAVCKTASDEEAEIFECDKCLGGMKFVCSEFGKDGAISTFILFAIALIFFLF